MTNSILAVKKVCTKCLLPKDSNQFGKSSANKSGKRPECKQCRKLENAEWRKNNPEYYKKYKISCQKRDRTEYKKQYYQLNKEIIINKSLLRAKKFPEEYAKRAMHRIALKINATPKWASHEDINFIYKQSKVLSEINGEVFHVDHIVPLKSNIVCGLHVENNLQILSASENIKKSNRIWPDMP